MNSEIPDCNFVVYNVSIADNKLFPPKSSTMIGKILLHCWEPLTKPAPIIWGKQEGSAAGQTTCGAPL